jgi:hypothetical protein
MKRIWSLFFLLLASTLVLGSQSPGDWTKFDTVEGHFAILMPCQPKESKETTQSSVGPYDVTLHTCVSNGEMYMVGWVDYAPSFNFDDRKELDANRDNFVKGMNGTLKSSSAITYKNYPSLEFEGANENHTFQSRVYIVGRRPYMIIVIYPNGRDSSLNIRKFFSSFDMRSEVRTKG